MLVDAQHFCDFIDEYTRFYHPDPGLILQRVPLYLYTKTVPLPFMKMPFYVDRDSNSSLKQKFPDTDMNVVTCEYVPRLSRDQPPGRRHRPVRAKYEAADNAIHFHIFENLATKFERM